MAWRITHADPVQLTHEGLVTDECGSRQEAIKLARAALARGEHVLGVRGPDGEFLSEDEIVRAAAD
ncbi:hypothetical protein [Methylobacterium sp. PvR107]|uniref:hypothetical protein n=1 Tax=Methylobacterium sp. PvR107 TaxID=2806597 RepID=UPI001AEB181A|nr:hypothetical protein [Methylobacterium sp. PvR107]MBP1179959.1 hypothetical protein [Methylobacterium sp. PvR107]